MSVDYSTIPRVVLVFNGELQMSPGKMAAQAFQACQRIYRAKGEALDGGDPSRAAAISAWEKHTTTIARVAKTTAMFERVCREVPGVVMIDEGFTEVEPDTATVFASWPAVRADEHKLLSNAKVQLLKDTVEPFAVWPDEHLCVMATALEALQDLSGEVPDALLEQLRAAGASRHLKFPGLHGREWAPETWLI